MKKKKNLTYSVKVLSLQRCIDNIVEITDLTKENQ